MPKEHLPDLGISQVRFDDQTCREVNPLRRFGASQFFDKCFHRIIAETERLLDDHDVDGALLERLNMSIAEIERDQLHLSNQAAALNRLYRSQ
jgi:hypothetical protein